MRGREDYTLTPKQKLFIAEYLIDFNATRAAREAGYKGSDETLAVVGWENLRKPKIAEAIERHIEERMMSAEEVHLRWGKIARFDLSPYVIRYGPVMTLDVDKMVEDGHGDMLRSVYQTKDGPRVELADQDKALENIAKALGMFVNKHEHTGKDGGEMRVRFIDYGLEYDDESTD